MKSLLKPAYSKINIGLQVLNKRPDGFHEINTLFYKTKLADEIFFYESPEFRFKCDSLPEVCTEDNIAYRAVKLFGNKLGINDLPVGINLIKNIPAGAGLGGGSSDAAAILTGLNEFLGLNASHSSLYEIAVMLGSDVPFFLLPGAATGTGRGELLDYFDCEIPYYVLIVHPGINISTKWAYQSIGISLQKNRSDFRSALEANIYNPKLLAELIYNDFEDVIFVLYPEISGIKDELYRNGAIYAQMTGSGSAVFGFFRSAEEAVAASKLFLNYFTYISKP